MSKSKNQVGNNHILKWSEKLPTDNIRFKHFIANTPFGKYVIITYHKNNVDYYDLLETPWGNNEDFYTTEFYSKFMNISSMNDMQTYLEKDFKRRLDESNKLLLTNTKGV